MNQNKYFFCYNPNLSRYLKSKGFNYVTRAKHYASNKEFTLYEYTKEIKVHIVERNRKVKNLNGTLIGKKPNKYKINISSYNIEEQNMIIINNDTQFNDVVMSFFDLKELHNILPRRHYDELKAISNT
ncbi:hypothetical protein [Siminovitchia fordii]|uniref:Uncharacterized protein n=1 Tax=Siminovitchia fordii TaxID=254759 RepID=A0ABQ4KC68_9BACI|nr:hypothetical protein [Siminovitchia fordii]GIN22622.1 hypothetical protein J1TS3_37560 [Siminovitchia fordii]